jgi:hypothetical protein
MAEKEAQNPSVSVKPGKLGAITEGLIKGEGYISLIFFALVFVFALCMSTNISNLINVDNTAAVNVSDGTVLPIHYVTAPWYNVSPKENTLMVVGIVGCILSLLYNMFRNNARRIYYVTNYVVEFALVAYTIFTCVMVAYVSSYFGEQYASINFGLVNATDDQLASTYGTLASTYSQFSRVHYALDPISTTTAVPAIGYVLTALIAVNGGITCWELFYKWKTGTALFKKIYSEPSSKVETEAK